MGLRKLGPTSTIEQPPPTKLRYNYRQCTIRYDTIEEINVDSKAEYTA